MAHVEDESDENYVYPDFNVAYPQLMQSIRQDPFYLEVPDFKTVIEDPLFDDQSTFIQELDDGDLYIIREGDDPLNPRVSGTVKVRFRNGKHPLVTLSMEALASNATPWVYGVYLGANQPLPLYQLGKSLHNPTCATNDFQHFVRVVGVAITTYPRKDLPFIVGLVLFAQRIYRDLLG